MRGFTYFSSYHKALRNLPDSLRLILYDAINDYMFENVEPEFEDATANALFELMRPNLDRSKKNGKNGESESTENRNEIESESTENRNEIENEKRPSYPSPYPSSNPDPNSGKEKGGVGGKEKPTPDEKAVKYPTGFTEFWEAYPRKADKGASYKKYLARLNDGYSPEELTRAAKAYRADCEKNRTEERYIKHAKTFLGDSMPFVEYLAADSRAAPDPYLDGFTPGKNPYTEDDL